MSIKQCASCDRTPINGRLTYFAGSYYCDECFKKQVGIVTAVFGGQDSLKPSGNWDNTVSNSTVLNNNSPLNKQEGGDHYKNSKIQPVEYIHANGLGFCEGNVIKYVTRHKSKNGSEDIKKAIHYLELLLELEYNEK